MPSIIGQPLNRIEGRRKVTGAANYAADHAIEDLVHAVGVTSTIASGVILSIDTDAAEASPGVLAVLHAGNVRRRPRRCPEEITVAERRPPFEDDRVYYAGQYVALVVATTLEQARVASRLVQVTYRESSWVTALSEATAARGGDTTADEPETEVRGRPREEYERGHVKLDATYTTPVEVHHAMELHAAIARWVRDRLIIHDSTQWVVGQAEALAHTFGVPEKNVVVHAPFVGGGFGGKLFLWPHSILAALAARELRRPVKFILDRRSQCTTAGHRPTTRQRIRLAATADGMLSAILHDSVSHTSLVHDYLESCADLTRSLYRCAHVGTTQRKVAVNVGTPTPMRGPGETPGLWALESALDELAVQLQADPLDLRLRNLPERDEDKDKPWSSHTHAECLKLAAERFGWARRNPEPGSMRDGAEVLGWGIASASWPGHRDETRMRVEFTAKERIRVVCATQDIGTGTSTVLAQVVSELTGWAFEQIDVVIGDSTLPAGPISGGSMVTATVVPAVASATRKAIESLKHLALQHHTTFRDSDPQTLTLTREGVHDPTRGQTVPVGALLLAAGRERVGDEIHVESGAGSEAASIRSFGAHCIEVRWDPRIARLRVHRVVSVIDAGRIINRKTAENQVYGSIMMGLGMALLEHSEYDPRTGRVVTDNLADYLLPVHADTPEMDLTLLDRPDPLIGEFGARGIGEIGITGVAPAIANAVYHATGKRIRDLPITVERLLA